MLKHLSLILSILLLSACIEIHGQGFQNRLDSLENELTKLERDTNMANLHIQLALDYRQYNPRKVFEHANKALELSQELDYKKGIAASYNRLGSFYRQTGSYAKAVDFYLKALNYYELVGDIKGMSFCYNGIGAIFRIEQFYDKAIEYHTKALELAKIQSDSVGISIYLRNIAVCFYDQKMYNESLKYALESYEIAKTTNNANINISALQAVGNYYLNSGEVKKAVDYFQKALTLGEKTENRYSEVFTLNRLADCYLQLGDDFKAKDLLLKALRIGKELGAKHDIKDSYFGLSLVYEKMGEYKSAFANHRLYSQYNDSIFSAESKQKISELQQLYEIEQQKMEIELLTKNNQLNTIKIKRQRLLTLTFILTFLLAIGYVSLLSVSNRRKQRSNAILLKQNKEILNQKREIEEQALELKKLSIVASHTNNAIMIMKSNGDIDWVNEAFTRIYGYTLDEFILERGTNILRIPVDNEVSRNLEACILGHQPVTYDVQVPCKNGSKIWIQTTVTPIRSIDRNIQNFVAIDTDITTSKKFELDLKERNEEITVQRDNLAELNAELHQKNEEIQAQHDYLMELNTELHTKNEEILAQRDELEKTQSQLVQSEKMASLGVLTAGIAHEINNPINFVFAGVNVLKRDFEDISSVLDFLFELRKTSDPTNNFFERIVQKMEENDFGEAYNAIRQTLDDIQLGARRTAEIVEGLRNYARTEKEDWAELDMHKVINGVLLLLKNNYKNRINIIKNYQTEEAIIHCKAGRLDQALLNIVSNAIDAIEDKGEILITTKIENSQLNISIKDSGKGINEEVLNKIFDPFFTTKQVGKGLGLGLSITYGIIKEHNGNIKVNSQIGVGTEFIITLPIIQPKS
jgi:PAS domain S-box-containing protein